MTGREFPDAAHLVQALADDVAAQLRAAIDARGGALIALSGGSSPKPLFARLAQQATLPWDRVTVAQVDERWLPVTHADSNARLISEHLLQGPATAARFVPMKNEADSPQAGQAACEATLRGLPLPFDLVLLGMGDDGHTASWFPHAPRLADALRSDGPLCIATDAPSPPQAPYPRMTLTLAAVASARRRVLLLQGRGKLEVLRKAQQVGPVDEMPIRALLRSGSPSLEIWSSP
ncbi:MAG: 6-phosphogluconolactonase [Panacagrimonas sp.]|nr:6-phosphogluconolactonase [Panacagrimonas sp.]MCC2655286.1 6-phosphogluconolactonase [Panacagrimonas sp.]